MHVWLYVLSEERKKSNSALVLFIFIPLIVFELGNLLKMFQYIISFLPNEEKKRTQVSILITVIASVLLTVIGIYGIGVYGLALFALTPIFIGCSPVLLVGSKFKISKNRALAISFVSLGLFVACLLVFALEGLICIAMAAPFAIFFCWLGSYLTYWWLYNGKQKSYNPILILIFSIPVFSFMEKGTIPEIHSVSTSIEIIAEPKEVWKQVVEFPPLAEPNEFLFKMGISYPTHATIKGTGVGAIRYCEFNTGAFVEPITTWDEPNLLAFDVKHQPLPMIEYSFWDIDAPHLHDYFISKNGQFKISLKSNGKTELVGTTWYTHNIRPSLYWQLWSEYIIHKIHNRVLLHIKSNAEQMKSQGMS